LCLSSFTIPNVYGGKRSMREKFFINLNKTKKLEKKLND